MSGAFSFSWTEQPAIRAVAARTANSGGVSDHLSIDNRWSGLEKTLLIINVSLLFVDLPIASFNCHSYLRYDFGRAGWSLAGNRPILVQF